MSLPFVRWRLIALICAFSAALLACDGRPGSTPLPIDPGPVPKPKSGFSNSPSTGLPATHSAGRSAPAGAAHGASGAVASASKTGRIDVDQLRIPYVPRQEEAPLSEAAQYIGAYPQDGVNYLTTGVLAERLKSLLGSQYPLLLQNFGTVGPLTEEGGVLSLIGLRPHQGGSEAAAVVIDPQRNGLRVWLLSEGKATVFTDVEEPDIAWPAQVQTTINNALELAAKRKPE